MIEKYEHFDETNHCPNVRKQKNQELEEDQNDYKIQHSGFRSKIESELLLFLLKSLKDLKYIQQKEQQILKFLI